MRYYFEIQNKHKDTFTVESVDEYQSTYLDIKDFTKVLQDDAVRKYITDEVMIKYNFLSVDDLSKDILDLCSKRWTDREELRFLIRNSSKRIVGMIGVDLLNEEKGDLWYFKISSSPSFMLYVAKQILPILKSEGITQLIANVKQDNLRSKEILKELGFNETDKENQMEMKL